MHVSLIINKAQNINLVITKYITARACTETMLYKISCEPPSILPVL